MKRPTVEQLSRLLWRGEAARGWGEAAANEEHARWERLPESTRDHYATLARNALAAIPESTPTEAERDYYCALERVCGHVSKWYPVSVPCPRDITMGDADEFRELWAAKGRAEKALQAERARATAPRFTVTVNQVHDRAFPVRFTASIPGDAETLAKVLNNAAERGEI